ncbi:uncharacterized protein [Palaemon carinicauda]|uniref:uncharacterized protein n=1 Tax=Palaemon carinicauda TaxID=392227 RepID=UPI0035B65BA1
MKETLLLLERRMLSQTTKQMFPRFHLVTTKRPTLECFFMQETHSSTAVSVITVSSDTDVLVIDVSLSADLNIESIWIAFGKGKDLRWVPLYEISRSLVPKVRVPFFHTFSGYDTVSVFAGKGKLDIETNLKFIVLWVQNWFCYDVAISELKLNKGTVCDWSSFCREVVINWVLRRSKKIGGHNYTVEIDESKFGKRKYNVGRVIDGQWVFGGICQESREFFLVPVETRDRDTLLSLIKERIEPGKTIISDCWRAYNCLAEEGFKHLTVNHSLHFVDPQTQAHTNTVERKWRDVKNLVPKYGRRKKHFVGYLATSYFKLHVREPSQRLHVFLKAAAHLYQPTV